MDKPRTRAESGPMRFNDDWCGVFLRGDHAMVYAIWLDGLIHKLEIIDPLAVMALKELSALLHACDESNARGMGDCQDMKSFAECFKFMTNPW